MNRMLHVLLLGMEAALLIALCAAQALMPQAFTSILAFPWEQLGMWLRGLSLSGTTGNLCALALYVLICLLPAVVPLIRWRRKRLHPEDALLGLLSLVLFLTVYWMINPTLAFSGSKNPAVQLLAASEEGQAFFKALWGASVYVLLACYVALRLLRRFSGAELSRLHRYLRLLVWLVNAVLVYQAFGPALYSLVATFSDLRAGNTAGVGAADAVFLTLRYVAAALPYLLGVWVLLSALPLLRAMESEDQGAQAVQAANRLSKRAIRALTVTAAVSAGYHVLQILCMRWLSATHVSVQFPLLSLCLVLLALILARYVQEIHRLRADNELFV